MTIKNVEEVIRKRREYLGLGQKEIAEKLFMNIGTYSTKERPKGKSHFTTSELIICMKVLGLKTEDFIEDD